MLRKKDDRYEIYDLHLKDFTLSVTYLNRGKATTGHSHEMEEAYYFLKGHGRVCEGETTYNIKAGDVVVIPGGNYHRVYNDDCPRLVFLCIFKGAK